VVIAAARALWHTSTYYPDFLDLGFASWEGLWATFEGVHPRLEGLASWATTYRRAAWRDALVASGRQGQRLDELAEVMAERYVEGQRSGHPVLPGALELVERLAVQVPLALVTNGPPDIQRLKIDQAGIAPRFAAVLISGEVGIGKPDPTIFLRALELLEVAPEHAVMVGDSWERDVTGALSAGMRAVWISHGRTAPASDRRVSVVRGPLDVVLP
jgi:putative hydrolase of the HAD superfamily